MFKSGNRDIIIEAVQGVLNYEILLSAHATPYLLENKENQKVNIDEKIKAKDVYFKNIKK